MALTIRDNSKVAIMEEVTQGTYLAPASGANFVGVLSDGLEMAPAKELLERSVLTGSLGKVTPRTGTKSVAGSIGVEFKAGSTAGSAPQWASLAKAALGATRNASAITTKATGNTATVLQIADADIADLNVGDIIVVKQTGAFHVSPIVSKTTGTGTATVTMLVAHPSGDCADSVVIAAFRTYYTANSGHPTLSISKYVDDVIIEKALGCRVSSMSLEGFSTGALPSLTFAFEGLTFDREIAAPPFTQSLDTSLPPVVLNAKVYVDGSAVDVNELTFSMENTVGFATSTASANGRISSRVSSRTVTGSFNPYKQSDSIANYTKFVNNTEFSLFAYAANPTSTAGEFNEVVAYYLPKCIVTELAESDQDGVLQDAVSFSAGRGSSGSTEEIYISLS